MTFIEIVHYFGATARSYSVVSSLAVDAVAAGAEVSILDIGASTVIRQGFPPRWIAKLFGHTVNPHAFAAVLEQHEIDLIPLPMTKQELSASAAVNDMLEQALESELLTYFRLDHIPSTREARELTKRLRAAMHATYESLTERWHSARPDAVYIPNGRTSRQKAARLAAEELSIPIKLYENGRALPQSYYLGNTQPHDRVASQQELLDGFPLPQGKALAEVADTWLSHRMDREKGTNLFSQSWSAKGSDQRTEPAGKLAVFFASSFDEFVAFGPMWSIDHWDSQFDAFDRMMTILEEQGVSLVMRLHPNLGSKSRQYFLRETKEVLALQKRHPTLRIYWHNDPINSYDLVEQADYVIVERSTIGLEASLMGKPVWVTQASQWDLVADVRQMLAPSEITEDSMRLWKPSPRGAQQFVAYWVAQEFPFRFPWETWSDWDPERAPLSMKIAQLAVNNSWRHKIRLVRLELAQRRNRRFVPPEK